VTLNEFADVTRFPLTTWPGLSAEAQALSDACDLEELRSVGARWNRLTRLQRGRLAELEQKADQTDPQR
jgi:hypothetical protein